MKKICIIGILLSLLILSSCATESKTTRINQGDLMVLTLSSDKVICYYHARNYAGGMDCFRDADLVVKYCT